jgi:carboxypeptidase C (cathepsin A)
MCRGDCRGRGYAANGGLANFHIGVAQRSERAGDGWGKRYRPNFARDAAPVLRILYVHGASKSALSSSRMIAHNVCIVRRRTLMALGIRAVISAAFACALLACTGMPGPVARRAGEGAADLAVTQHSIQLHGKRLAYRAEAGRLPIRDQATGEVHGEMYFTAYRVPSSTLRPVAFIWNGGPGANSLLLHFEAFGPRAFVDGQMVDNQLTLLDVADLVFVDPVGTGFSRPVKREYEAEFYNTLGDHQSVAEFIRMWRLRFDAQTAPVYMIGESFGTWRAAGVAEIMAKRGLPVAGIVLVSGGAGVGDGYDTRPQRAGFRIPGRALAALHHGKLDRSVGTDAKAVEKAAETWAASAYTPALARLDQLNTTEREAIARDLARFIGVPAEAIDRQKLELTPREYLALLLKAEGKTLNTFDMRITGGESDPTRAARIDSYFREDLGYRTDLGYAGLGGGLGEAYSPTGSPRGNINSKWNYNSGEITPEVMARAQAGEGPPGSQPWAVNAVKADPKMRVMVAAGIYDSLNSCAQNNALKLKLEPAVAPNFTMACYYGGHMMYRDRSEGIRLADDVRAFINAAR